VPAPAGDRREGGAPTAEPSPAAADPADGPAAAALGRAGAPAVPAEEYVQESYDLEAAPEAPRSADRAPDPFAGVPAIHVGNQFLPAMGADPVAKSQMQTDPDPLSPAAPADDAATPVAGAATVNPGAASAGAPPTPSPSRPRRTPRPEASRPATARRCLPTRSPTPSRTCSPRPIPHRNSCAP
jgi:hypothetical protein